jgi:hypothetical protein
MGTSRPIRNTTAPPPRDFDPGEVYFVRSVANVLAAAVRSRQADQACATARRGSAPSCPPPSKPSSRSTTGTVDSLNHAPERMFGYQAADVLGTGRASGGAPCSTTCRN